MNKAIGMLAGAALLLWMAPANAATFFFTNDHCTGTCGGAVPYASITLTDTAQGVDIRPDPVEWKSVQHGWWRSQHLQLQRPANYNVGRHSQSDGGLCSLLPMLAIKMASVRSNMPSPMTGRLAITTLIRSRSPS